MRNITDKLLAMALAVLILGIPMVFEGHDRSVCTHPNSPDIAFCQ